MSARKRIRLAIFITIPVITAVISIASTPILKRWWQKEPTTTQEANDNQKDPAQEAMMQELRAWLQPFDSSNTGYYLNGLLTAVDKTDSANAMVNSPYTVCKNGKQLYVRMGKTETVNTNAQYVFVDHEAQKILLRKAKAVINTSGLPTGDLFEFIRGEGYTFTKTAESNGRWTISMQNPHHISTKEFTVQYDSTLRHPKEIFIRQADITDPMNPDKEKWITLIIREWNDSPDVSRYLDANKFIRAKQDTWECAPAYKNYELIVR